MRVGGLGAPELILIAPALVLVFGAGKVGEIGGALGKSVRDFKKAMHDDKAPEEPQPEVPAPAVVSSALSTPPPVPEHRPARSVAEAQPSHVPNRATDDGPAGTMPAA